MTKIDDVVIKSNDRPLREWIADLVTLWNKGKIGFTLIAAEPSDVPSDVEIRVYDSGADVVRIYVYAPSSAAWFWVEIPNKV